MNKLNVGHTRPSETAVEVSSAARLHKQFAYVPSTKSDSTAAEMTNLVRFLALGSAETRGDSQCPRRVPPLGVQ